MEDYYNIYAIIPFAYITKATVFNIISDFSFHAIETNNQPESPTT